MPPTLTDAEIATFDKQNTSASTPKVLTDEDVASFDKGNVGNQDNSIANAITRVPGVMANSAGKAIGSTGDLTNPTDKGSGLLGAVTHPADTAEGVLNAALHPMDTAKSIGKYAIDRYGSAQKAINTLSNDPVGSILDASTVLGGVGGLAGKVGEAANLPAVANAGKGMVAAANVPFQAAGKIVGNVAGGVSNIAGITTEAKNGIANMLLNPEYKQSGADWDYNHDARRVMATMPDIVGDNFDATKKAILAKTQETGQSIGNTIANSEASNQPIGLTENDIVGHIDDQIAELNKADPAGNAPTIRKLMEKRISLLNQFDSNGNVVAPHDFENMTPQQAFDFKEQKLGNVKFTGNDGVDLTPVNNALQQSRANIVTKMNAAVPELAPLNQDYGDLKAAYEGADKAAFKAQGQGLGSIKWQDVLTLGLDKWLLSPTNRVKMAQFLYTAPKEDVAAISKIVPNFQNTINTTYARSGVNPSLNNDVEDAQIVPRTGIGYQKPLLRPDRRLPSPQDAGQSSGPVILGQPQPKLPAPPPMVTRPTIQQPETPDVIPMRGASQAATQNLSTPPKTSPSIANQPNPRAQFDMSKGGYEGFNPKATPNATRALINAHSEVLKGNLQPADVQDTLSLAKGANDAKLPVKAPGMKVFNNLQQLQNFVKINGSKIERFDTDKTGKFYVHMKGKNGTAT